MTFLCSSALQSSAITAQGFTESSVSTAMRDDVYRILMEDSQMAFFDYDVPADDLCLSLILPDGERCLRRYPAFFRTLHKHKGIPADLRQSLLVAVCQYCEKPGKGSFSLCLDLFLCGEYRWYLAFLHSFCGADNRVNRIIGRLRDVQAEKLTELRLQNLSIYQHAVGSASLFVFEFELPSFQPHIVSDAQRYAGDFYPLEQYLDPICHHLIHPEDCSSLFALIDENTLLTAYHDQRYELVHTFRILNRHAQWIWVQLTLHLSYGSRREARGIGYIQIIQERKSLEERANLDSITGLFNRASTEEQIGRALSGAFEPCYFFIFDIDNFKSINDAQGHAAGDRALRLIASALREHIRYDDVLGRIGGDEFVALLRGLSSPKAARRRAAELLAAVRDIRIPEFHNGTSPLTITIGIAHAPQHGSTFAQLYCCADRALYRAKGAGKNQFCFDGSISISDPSVSDL